MIMDQGQKLNKPHTHRENFGVRPLDMKFDFFFTEKMMTHCWISNKHTQTKKRESSQVWVIILCNLVPAGNTHTQKNQKYFGNLKTDLFCWPFFSVEIDREKNVFLPFHRRYVPRWTKWTTEPILAGLFCCHLWRRPMKRPAPCTELESVPRWVCWAETTNVRLRCYWLPILNSCTRHTTSTRQERWRSGPTTSWRKPTNDTSEVATTTQTIEITKPNYK